MVDNFFWLFAAGSWVGKKLRIIQAKTTSSLHLPPTECQTSWILVLGVLVGPLLCIDIVLRFVGAKRQEAASLYTLCDKRSKQRGDWGSRSRDFG